MNNKIIDFLKSQPMLYAESDDAFWDDEHISKYMLAAHLNPDCDNASRKQEGILNSVNWITELSGGPTKKKLLDLGCGPGIYAELLAEKGFQVTGIDFSQRSVNYAIDSSKEKNLDITYHYQNYLDIDYEEEFDVVILIYCDFGVLSPENRSVLLRKIHQALKPGGILIDKPVFIPSGLRSSGHPGRVVNDDGTVFSYIEVIQSLLLGQLERREQVG